MMQFQQKTLWELRELPENQKCMDCSDKFPRYVCLTFSTFVCASCSRIHKEFGHLIKSPTLDTFTEEEIENLRKGGNRIAAEKWLKYWNSSKFHEPLPSETDKIKEFIKQKYINGEWSCVNKPVSDISPKREQQRYIPQQPLTVNELEHHNHKHDTPKTSHQVLLTTEVLFPLPLTETITTAFVPLPNPPLFETIPPPLFTDNMQPANPFYTSDPVDWRSNNFDSNNTNNDFITSFSAPTSTPSSPLSIQAHTYVSSTLGQPPPENKYKGFFNNLMSTTPTSSSALAPAPTPKNPFDQPLAQRGFQEPSPNTNPFTQAPMQPQFQPQQPQQQQQLQFQPQPQFQQQQQPQQLQQQFSFPTTTPVQFAQPQQLQPTQQQQQQFSQPVPNPHIPINSQIVLFDRTEIDNYQLKYQEKLQELNLQREEYEKRAQLLAQYQEQKLREEQAKDAHYQKALAALGASPPPQQPSFSQPQQQTPFQPNFPPQQPIPQQSFQQQYSPAIPSQPAFPQQQQNFTPQTPPQGYTQQQALPNRNVLELSDDQAKIWVKMQKDKQQVYFQDLELAKKLQAEEDAEFAKKASKTSSGTKPSQHTPILSQPPRSSRQRANSVPTSIEPIPIPHEVKYRPSALSGLRPVSLSANGDLVKCACGTEIPKSQFATHQAQDCVYRPFSCHYCTKTVRFAQYKEHLEKCAFERQQCTQCGQVYLGHQIPEHLKAMHGIVRPQP